MRVVCAFLWNVHNREGDMRVVFFVWNVHNYEYQKNVKDTNFNSNNEMILK